jgi:hypothetical protein
MFIIFKNKKRTKKQKPKENPIKPRTCKKIREETKPENPNKLRT